MSPLLTIARKELKATFGSPMAAIFIGAFLLSALFSFFWLETFFARNIADLRPLFRWMPLLMIFLSAALTMRQWSEEQKMGTLEILLTLPVRLSHLVLGKFLAVLTLVALALLLTSGLPITVSVLGNMDWGPVIGGYLGALLLASAYIAIGLFISSRTDNQIVALILTVLVAGFFYILGSPGITNFMGNTGGEIFRNLGTGSRFTSIERGVIDLRDLWYYGSLSGLFLLLNIISLDKKRWSCGQATTGYRRGVMLTGLLVAANLLATNIWLSPVTSTRLDLTENQDYSISQTTRDLLAGLDEPLIMRGYFSAKTHPLLAPLAPRIRDLLEEYRIAAQGKIEVGFIDPREDQDLEGEANQLFGIKPLPFQVEGRYESSVVSSYFHILIKYGDQHVVLGFDDLIEIQRRAGGQLDVQLRNLEYDLTKSIKKTVYGFQSLAAVFQQAREEMEVIVITTPSTIPETIANMPAEIDKATAALQKESGGKLHVSHFDPTGLNEDEREQLNTQYNILPLASSFFSEDTFYLHLFLRTGETLDQIHIAMDMGEGEIRQEMEAAIKRSSSGFLQTVGVWTPKNTEHQMYQPQAPATDNYQLFQTMLRENYNLESIDLSEGRAPGHLDVLLVVAPHDMSDLERFALDQYLMRGGSVVVLTSSHLLDISPYSQNLEAKKTENGIADLLAHYGVTVEESLVMDLQNEPFPIPVSRDLGGFVVQEIQHMAYPFFVDVRKEGMDDDNPITANLPAITMNWASPLEVDHDKLSQSKISTLLHSSSNSWSYLGASIQPDFDQFPQLGFPTDDAMAKRPLALTIQGGFTSFFADKPDPRQQTNDNGEPLEQVENKDDQETQIPPLPVIKTSPDSTRLVVVGSAEFVNDMILSMSRNMGQDRFLNSLQFLQNTIDWSTEDEGLLTIRSRGSHARLLSPMTRSKQTFWEWLNYGIALVSLIIISFLGLYRRKREEPMELEIG